MPSICWQNDRSYVTWNRRERLRCWGRNGNRHFLFTHSRFRHSRLAILTLQLRLPLTRFAITLQGMLVVVSLVISLCVFWCDVTERLLPGRQSIDPLLDVGIISVFGLPISQTCLTFALIVYLAWLFGNRAKRWSVVFSVICISGAIICAAACVYFPVHERVFPAWIAALSITYCLLGCSTLHLEDSPQNPLRLFGSLWQLMPLFALIPTAVAVVHFPVRTWNVYRLAHLGFNELVSPWSIHAPLENKAEVVVVVLDPECKACRQVFSQLRARAAQGQFDLYARLLTETSNTDCEGIALEINRAELQGRGWEYLTALMQRPIATADDAKGLSKVIALAPTSSQEQQAGLKHIEGDLKLCNALKIRQAPVVIYIKGGQKKIMLGNKFLVSLGGNSPSHA